MVLLCNSLGCYHSDMFYARVAGMTVDGVAMQQFGVLSL